MFLLILLSASCFAERLPWGQLHRSSNPTGDGSGLSTVQRANLKRLLLAREQEDVPDCEGDPDDPHWEDKVRVSRVRLGAFAASLVEAGAGCARSGQGANGAMWLVRWEGSRPVLIADPEAGFYGWFYGVQAMSSHGLRDIVLGSHVSAFEYGLEWLRFDGRAYRSVGGAEDFGRDAESLKRMGGMQVCRHAKKPCTLLRRKDSILVISQ